MSTALILDTETTDVENCEVMELAWQTHSFNMDMAITGTVRRFKPSRPPAWGALATHHILMEELEGMPPAITAPSAVPEADYWIGHNVDFDWRALGQPPVRRICTLALSRAIWPLVDSHNLVAMTYFTRMATAETKRLVAGAHGAAVDVQLCALLLDAICRLEEIGDLETLHRFSEEARVPKVWAFGKFKGQPIKSADRGYANWYQRQADTDPYVIEALKRARLL